MSYFVYIHKMIDGRFYTGMTNNLARREGQHGVNPSTRTTYIFGAGQKIYYEEHPDRASAHARERQIKKWSKAKKLALADGDVELLKTLSKRRCL
jgi:putative endonuclease